MGVNLMKTSHIAFFGMAMPILGWYISVLFFKLFPNWPNWMESISPMASYTILYFLFDKIIWKWKLFRTLSIVTFPDLNGRWEGFHRSSFKKNGKNIEVPTHIEISQNFSSINIKGYYEKSESNSVTSSFKELGGEIFLYYTYDNDPNTLKGGTMQSHKGTAKIKYLARDNKIKGFYWNSIGNQGDIVLKFKSNQTFGRF